MKLVRSVSCAMALCALLPSLAPAGTAVLQASKDSTLIEEPDGLAANGAGQYIFTGLTVVNSRRRTVLAFDVAGSIPAGVTVTGATLVLTLSRAFSSQETPVELHRVTTDWLEGSSDPAGEEGGGTASDRGDSTWMHTNFADDFWTTPGGDFDPGLSAVTNVGGSLTGYSWSSPQLVADVQDMLDNPADNHGWIVIGDEMTLGSAKRFGARQAPLAGQRPRLIVTFTAPGGGAGRIPDRESDGMPLRLTKLPGGMVQLDWGASCLATDTDYGVLEGTIGIPASDVPRICTTGGALTASLAPANAGSYFLVVAINGLMEGSHGLLVFGVERELGFGTCRGREIAACP
jgi:hypothetical protein